MTTPDTVLMIFTKDNRLVLSKTKDGAAKPVSVKSYQESIARTKELFGLDITLDSNVKIHQVQMQFARTTTEPSADNLVVFESLEKYLEDVPYDERTYPLRCKGWQSAAFSFLKKEE